MSKKFLEIDMGKLEFIKRKILLLFGDFLLLMENIF